MNRKVKIALVLGAIALLVGGIYTWNRSRSRPPVELVFQIRVQPADRVDLVLAKANSARFKYVLGKISSTKPYLAQQLRLNKLPASAELEARINLNSNEEARKYLERFVEALQDFCGSDVALTLVQKTTR